MNITGVNFINIVQAAFTQADPESIIKILKLSVFTLSESACKKANYRTLMKLTPGGLIRFEARSRWRNEKVKIELNINILKFFLNPLTGHVFEIPALQCS